VFLSSRWLKLFLCAVLVGGLTLHGSAARADDSDFYDGKIHVGFTPYIWLPTINGTFKYDLSDVHQSLPSTGGSFGVKIGPNNYLTNINFALMGAGQIRQGNWALVADYINTNVGAQNSSFVSVNGPLGRPLAVTGSVQSRAVTQLLTVGPSYTVFRKDATAVNVLLGGRFVFATASADWQLSGPLGFLNPNGSASRSQNDGDVIIGTYGQFGLCKHWSVPYYFDMGTGTPSFTWQGLLGVKYGQASLSYRHLSYSGGTGLIQSLQLSGPQFGYSFRF